MKWDKSKVGRELTKYLDHSRTYTMSIGVNEQAVLAYGDFDRNSPYLICFNREDQILKMVKLTMG